MRFMYSNTVDGGTLTESSEQYGYEAENLQDTRLSNQWRTIVCTSAENVLIDMAAAISCDTVLIAGHNLTSAATVQLLADSSATDVLNPSAAALVETITYREDVLAKFFTSASYRYWNLRVTDTANSDGCLKIGRLFVGEYMEPDPNSLYNFTVIDKRNDLVSYSPGREVFAQEGVGYREFNFAFPPTGEATLSKIRTMYSTVGKHKPLFFMNFEDLWTYELVLPVYCMIGSDPKWRRRSGNRWSYGMKLVEVK